MDVPWGTVGHKARFHRLGGSKNSLMLCLICFLFGIKMRRSCFKFANCDMALILHGVRAVCWLHYLVGELARNVKSVLGFDWA